MKKAFTLPEVLISMSILGVLAVIMIAAMRPWEIKDEAIIATGQTVRNQIENATQQILARSTKGFTFKALKDPADSSTTYSIEDSENIDSFGDIFIYYLKSYIKAKGERTAKLAKKCKRSYKGVCIEHGSSDMTTFLDSTIVTPNGELKDSDGAKVTLKVSDFSAPSGGGVGNAYIARSDVYLAVQLFGNCDTEIKYIYDITRKPPADVKKVCGLIFYDVNSDEAPNVLGVDQYIIPIGKIGIK